MVNAARLGLGRTSHRERTGAMMDRAGRASAPFPPEYRASGVLLHVTSLPSPYGIGDLGPSARAWVDRLADAGQSWWQALPLGPTGYGNSPYQSLSSFAGNELLISPEDLIEDGLLRAGGLRGQLRSRPTAVDYAAVIPFKRRLLENAWGNFAAGSAPTYGPPLSSSATRRRTGWTITRCSER